MCGSEPQYLVHLDLEQTQNGRMLMIGTVQRDSHGNAFESNETSDFIADNFVNVMRGDVENNNENEVFGVFMLKCLPLTQCLDSRDSLILWIFTL